MAFLKKKFIEEGIIYLGQSNFVLQYNGIEINIKKIQANI